MTTVWRFAPYIATVSILAVLAVAFEATFAAREQSVPRPTPIAEASAVAAPPADPEPQSPAAQSEAREHDCKLLGMSGEYEGVHFESQIATDPQAPAVVMIHGRGQSPATMRKALADFDFGGRIIFPRGFVPSGNGWRWMKARTRHPEFGDDLRDDIIHLTDFLVEVEACFGRFVVAGHSQGGHIAYALAVTMPDRLLAAVGTSGTLPLAWDPGSFRVPVVAIHGRRDPIVPFAWTQEMVEARGGRLRAIDGRRHRLVGPMKSALLEELTRAVQRRARPTPLSATDLPTVCDSTSRARRRSPHPEHRPRCRPRRDDR